MWTIDEMKRRGWETLKPYYWPALGVTLISALLGGGSSSSGFRVGAGGKDHIIHSFESMSPGARHMFFFTLLGILGVTLVAVILFKIFIGNPIVVGKNRYFMESRMLKRSAGIGKVFWVFGCGNYINVVKIMFLRDLYTWLWSLLLVIPGIYKGYEYAMIPYILSENPDADSRDVFAVTKDMMEGSRFQLFCLQLSFIGWYLLGMLLCCVGGLLVTPYEEASVAELYYFMRGQISGFPFNGYGIPEPEVFYDQNGRNDEYYGNDRYNRNDGDSYGSRY